MDAIQVYALLNKKIKGLTSGVQSAVVNGTTITFTMHDGSKQEMTFDEPEDGISVTGMSIDENNHLVCSMSDGSTIDSGELPTINNEEVNNIVEEKVQEQIETQLDDTIQEKVDKAIEDVLGGGSSGSDVEDEIDSWF